MKLLDIVLKRTLKMVSLTNSIRSYFNMYHSILDTAEEKMTNTDVLYGILDIAEKNPEVVEAVSNLAKAIKAMDKSPLQTLGILLTPSAEQYINSIRTVQEEFSADMHTEED